MLAACSTFARSPQASPTAYPSETSVIQELSTATPPTSQQMEPPQAYVLKVPAEWAQAAAEVLKETNEAKSEAVWQLDVGTTSADDLAAGWVDAVLIEGGPGMPVGKRPIALARDERAGLDRARARRAGAVRRLSGPVRSRGFHRRIAD